MRAKLLAFFLTVIATPALADCPLDLGRGTGLFGSPDHDARTVRELLGPLPLAGLFCNGEIGPEIGRAHV